MKYLDLSTVVNAYINFQNTMTNKSWGYLALIRGCRSEIKPCVPFEVDMDSVSNFLETIFNLSSEKKTYNSTKSWYVVFSNQWSDFFSTQGRNIANIYDIAVWAFRRKAFDDKDTAEDILSKFINEFNLPAEVINSKFSINSNGVSFSNTIYDENVLKNELSKQGVNVSTENIDAKKSSVVAAPGELSRGPFIQTLYAGLEISDYILIMQSNYFNLYSFDCQNNNSPSSVKVPLQQIFYGAPGTGKSHKVKEVTETLPKSDVFRTTFHPDSDYSTFVGCYKPKMVKAPIRDGSGHEITSACEDEKKRIAYEYEPQAFLKAYVRAYETNEPVFLVIEEINRGNCAQIFGDMFQLLDRNENGESDYAIKPETAIQEFLNEKLKDCDIADETIKSGEEMRLPANLHIWATMNTSDQSLFPIDSAFKRRWDWKYVPINTRKESWSIKVNGAEYSWSDFLEKINEEIGSITNSEDKKLGFYFCKAENGVISAERFVSKVLFYIYNDVFKDYGFDKDIFNDTEGKLCFGKFYNDNGGIQEDKVELFLKNLRVDIIKTNDTSIDDPLPEVDEDGNNETTATKDFSKYSINGSGSYSKGSVVLEAMRIYIANNPLKNAEDIKNDWLALGVNVPNFVETQAMFDERKQRSRDSRINEKAKIATLQNGQTLYVSNQYNPERIANVISKINGANWNITISKV